MAIKCLCGKIFKSDLRGNSVVQCPSCKGHIVQVIEPSGIIKRFSAGAYRQSMNLA